MSETSLQNQLLRLGSFDPEKDAEIEAAFTLDQGYMAQVNPDLPRPLSAEQIKKRYENLDKRAEEENLYFFALRAQADDRLLGFAEFDWISWAHGSASLTLAVGDAQAKAEGWLRQAVEILAAYAFTELNLHSLNLRVPGYDQETQALLAEGGFTLEVRQRQAVQRDGQRWDVLRYGLLQPEWQQRQAERSQP